MRLSSVYSSDHRADALDALRQLRAAVGQPIGLRAEYRAMAIAEAKLVALGGGAVALARRLDSYAPPTVREVDEMIAAVDVEASKAACRDCDGGAACAECDGKGVTFEEAAA